MDYWTKGKNYIPSISVGAKLIFWWGGYDFVWSLSVFWDLYSCESGKGLIILTLVLETDELDLFSMEVVLCGALGNSAGRGVPSEGVRDIYCCPTSDNLCK